MKKRYKWLFFILLILISLNGYQWIKEIMNPFQEMIRDIRRLDSTVGIKIVEITDFRGPQFTHTITISVNLDEELRDLVEEDLRKFSLDIKEYIGGDKWKQAWIRKEGAVYQGRINVFIYGPESRGPSYVALDSPRVAPGEKKRIWWWKLNDKWMGRLE